MTLYIDTADQKIVKVALKKEGGVMVKMEGKNEWGSEVLLPLIVKLLKSQKINLADLTGIEVEKGPGSFTGLRVGAAVAQAFGFALNIPVNGQVGKAVELRYTESSY